MIDKSANPVEWAALMYELEDAQEHLAGLIGQLESDPTYEEENLCVDLGHVMAHLNRAWARRNIRRPITDQEWEAFREYQQDLRPIA